MSSEAWAQYADYARRLDAVRAEELARTAGMRQGVAEMTTHADTLEARLNGQAGMLTNLAGILRLRRPKYSPIPPPNVEEDFDPAVRLSELARIIDRGDAEARAAAERGEYPALLPKLSAPTRSLVVYGLAALGILAFQALVFSRSGTAMSPLTVLFLIPLVGFVIAFLVLKVGGRTRVANGSAEDLTRLGFVLCFVIGPLAGVVSVAVSFLSK
jgi:hypothetical protein